MTYSVVLGILLLEAVPLFVSDVEAEDFASAVVGGFISLSNKSILHFQLEKIKRPPYWVDTLLCWHLPIFTGRHQPTIVGTTGLNFCVRYGNRWTPGVIDTNLLILFEDVIS